MYAQEAVLSVVCEAFGTTTKDLRGPCKKKVFTKPRQIAMSLIRDVSGGSISFPQIGHYFSRDHTTVFHAVKQVRKMREAPSFAEDYRQMEDRARDMMGPAIFFRHQDVVFKSRRAG